MSKYEENLAKGDWHKNPRVDSLPIGAYVEDISGQKGHIARAGDNGLMTWVQLEDGGMTCFANCASVKVIECGSPREFDYPSSEPSMENA